jgi:hypothetical protein
MKGRLPAKPLSKNTKMEIELDVERERIRPPDLFRVRPMTSMMTAVH